MAKVFYGGVVTDARNKLGPVVYTRGRGGSYARAYVLTGVRHSTLQTAQRAAFKAGWFRWTTALTEAQRAAWNQFADRTDPIPKPIGSVKLTGQQWFVRCNAKTSWWNLTYVDTPPDDLQIFQLSNLTASCVTATTQMDVDVVGIPATPNRWAEIFCTRPLSPGIYAFTKYLVAVTALDFSTPHPKNIWTNYTSFFPAPTPGQMVGFAARALNVDNGVDGPILSARVICT